MNEGMKRALLCLLGGAGAAFMMYPILEDWPQVVTVVLTAAVYAPTGYIIRRAAKHKLWYSGVLINLPFWSLLFSWGFEELRARSLILAFALGSAYVGTWIGGRARSYQNKGVLTTAGDGGSFRKEGKTNDLGRGAYFPK